MPDSKSLSQKRYTQYADGYVTSQTHAKGADLKRLVDMADPQADWRALDVATGGGHTALTFAPRVGQIVATDLTWRMLQKARAHIEGQGVSNASFVPADAENLPFVDGTFDLVTCRIAPHHFPDCARFVREAARVVRQGRYVLVQDQMLPDGEADARYVDDFEKRRDPSHNRAFPHAGWVSMFEAAGLSVVSTDHLTKRHDLIEWAKRQGADDALIAELRERLSEAPPAVSEWLEPADVDGDAPSFVNHHLLILGWKA